jgi:hypothetical protein
MLAVIIGVMLASVGSARYVPYVPEVLHPPVPQEGKYEEKERVAISENGSIFPITTLKSDPQGTNFIPPAPQTDEPWW